MNPRRQRIRRAAAREAANLRVNAAPPPLVRPHFPGVDASDWTDLPPAQYPPDTVTFLRLALEAGERRTVKGYTCDTCSAVVATVDRHPGYSPDYVDHRRFVPATRCPGLCVSFGYPDEAPPTPPSHEWHRPSEPALLALLALPDEYADHVLRGGLLLRLNPDAADR